MAIRTITSSITISDLKDGESVDTSNCELAANKNNYSTAQDIDLELKFLDYGFIGAFKPVDGTGLDSLLCTSLSDIDNIFKDCSALVNPGVTKVLNKTLKTMNNAFYNVPASMTGNVYLTNAQSLTSCFIMLGLIKIRQCYTG